MKKILLLSDTHSYMDERILNYASNADEVWHAGDIGDPKVSDALKKVAPIFKAVYGNIDGTEIRKEFPLNQRFFCEKVDVWMTHIGGYPGRYSPAIKGEIYKNPPKLFICGHSHILKVMNDKTLHLLHMNPGAAGNYGIHKVKTLLRFEINETVIQNLEVIEFSR